MECTILNLIACNCARKEKSQCMFKLGLFTNKINNNLRFYINSRYLIIYM